MVEEVPFALVFSDASVCSPANNWLKQFALVLERSVRIVAFGIAEQMTVACRIDEEVFSILLHHP